MSDRRVVITGIEVLAPGGVGKDRFWDLLSEGRTATRGITFFTSTAENRATVGGPPSGGVTSVMPSSRATSGVTMRAAVTVTVSFAPLRAANSAAYIFSSDARPLTSRPV